MKIYLVGGAVRDKLLNLPVREKDWVVVGATPKQLLAQGYQPVGKDFPVFLHPVTKEEYALARTEKKVAPGYTGFRFNASSSVTLEEDLSRRDLTINAIAEDNTGSLIDPFNGQTDLKQKLLRHVSPAFSEDPVRLLRIARFAARFTEFNAAPETLKLMEDMVTNGEVNSLVPERVWQEVHKALRTKSPWRFFEILKACGALNIIFPLLEFNDTAKQALTKATQISLEPSIRFAALLSQTQDIKKLCVTLRCPKNFLELAELTQRTLPLLPCLTPNELLHFFEQADAFRRQERFWLLVDTLTACCSNAARYKTLWLNGLERCQAISIKGVPSKLQGKEIAAAIKELRLLALKDLLTL